MNRNEKRRVLVVDDNPEVRALCLGFVAALDHDVFAAENSELALLAIARVRPHLLVTDRDMPRMTGEILAENAKRIAPEIKVIMITGRDPEAVRATVNVASVDRILAKPFRIEELEAAIRGVLAAEAM